MNARQEIDRLALEHAHRLHRRIHSVQCLNPRALRRLEEGLPNDPVLIATATAQLDIGMHNRLIIVNAATSTLTLPQANGSGTFLQVVLGIVATSIIIKRALAADRMQGSITTEVDTASTGKAWQANSTTNANTITFNGTTSGGATIGDTVFLADIKTGVWAVWGSVMAVVGGGLVTPFSNT